MKGYHDLGGESAGPIETKEKEPTLWEKRVEALLMLLTRRGVLRVDENRRALESLGADAYHNATYAERRVMAISNNLILKGVISVDELSARLAEIERRADTLP